MKNLFRINFDEQYGRRIDISRRTIDSRTYKMFKRFALLSCPICPPNTGCNNKCKLYKAASWKLSRKTQYKILA